jgi:hypothetical protein
VDPNHVAWSVLYQVAEIRQYLHTFDVVGTDLYPITDGEQGQVAKESADMDTLVDQTDSARCSKWGGVTRTFILEAN